MKLPDKVSQKVTIEATDGTMMRLVFTGNWLLGKTAKASHHCVYCEKQLPKGAKVYRPESKSCAGLRICAQCVERALT